MGLVIWTAYAPGRATCEIRGHIYIRTVNRLQDVFVYLDKYVSVVNCDDALGLMIVRLEMRFPDVLKFY